MYRSFCRFLCPLGAIYGLFNRFNIIGVKVDENRCNHCGSCVRSCGMDVRRAGDRECINCGKCMAVCAQGAISIAAGSIVLMAPEKGCAGDRPDAPAKRRRLGRILWGIALAVLCFALLWFNVLDPAVRKNASGTSQSPAQSLAAAPAAAGTASEAAVSSDDTSDAPIGHEVGQQLADFTVTCFDGSEFHLADQRGKVTFINFWATYCTPCLQELPFFNDLYKKHEGDIAMLAVHSSFIADDPVAYMSGKDYVIPFATDKDDDEIFGIAGGGSTLPQTVVLNRKGEVIYNRVGSVTPEMLEDLYQQADS